MALVLNFDIKQSQDGSFYTITDLTGVYSTSNIGGWGSPNVELSNVVVATVDLQIMDEEGVFTSVLDASQKDVLNLPDFPNDSNGDIDKAVALKDGYYKAVYSITDDLSETYTATKYFTFYANFKCCFDKIALSVGDCGCASMEKKLKLLEAHTILSALEIAAANQSLTTGGGIEVFKTIEYATKFCSKCGCGCGG